MKELTNDEFAQAVMRLAKPQRPFKPSATYIREGDCIEFVIAPDDYRAHRIDGLVTVYYSRRSGAVVGSLIKGVSEFCRRVLARFPGFGIAIQGRTVQLEHLFLAQLWSEPPNPEEIVVRTYRELIAAAEQEKVAVDIDDLCLT